MDIRNKKFRLIDTILIPLRVSPTYSILRILYMIISALIPTINIWITTNFINTAISIINENKSLKLITMPLIYLILYTSWNILSSVLRNLINVKLTINMRKELRDGIISKQASLNYKYLESEASFDVIKRVTETPEEKFKNMFNDTLGTLEMVISIASILIVLTTQIWWAGILIVLISVPLMSLAIKSGEKSYEVNKEVTKIERKYNYLSEILTNRDSCLERTLFGYSDKLNNDYISEYEKARKIKLKINLKWFINMKSGSIITSCLSIIIVLVLLNPVFKGIITIGMFISLVNAVFSLIQSMSWQLSYNMEQLAKNKEFMKDLSEFSNFDEQEDAEKEPIQNVEDFESLEFKNVYFKYPNSNNYILKGLSFKIEQNKHYSFVGINGAGKTTITKLITGLFDEYEGQILLNGKDLKEYSLPYLKSMFCGVFQDFARYSLTVKDNIKIGNVNGATQDEIVKATDLVGITEDIYKMPKGFDTQLGKIKKEGIDISGGQWQRIAMARAIVNPAYVKILDEPTAALDPISESQIYENFENISKNKTTIFISHRLGSTLLADIIYVLNNGKIEEFGSHESLMRQNGKYAEMFESQKSWYN